MIFFLVTNHSVTSSIESKTTFLGPLSQTTLLNPSSQICCGFINNYCKVLDPLSQLCLGFLNNYCTTCHIYCFTSICTTSSTSMCFLQLLFGQQPKKKRLYRQQSTTKLLYGQQPKKKQDQ